MARAGSRPRDGVKLFFAWVLCWSLTRIGGAADLGGTDILSAEIAQGLAKASEGKIAVDFGGSLPARRALIKGSLPAAALFLRPGELAPTTTSKIALAEFHFATAAVVVAVHRRNPIEQLTLEQLNNAFAKEARSSALNWNDLVPAARSELITPAVCSPDRTMVTEIFQGIVLEGRAFRPDVRQRVAPPLALEMLTGRAGSMVLMAGVPEGVGRPVPLADGREGRSTTAYLPDANNLQNGDYPLQLPLVLYVRQDFLPTFRPALRWLFSDEGAALLEKQGLHPAPKAIRERFVQRLDTR